MVFNKRLAACPDVQSAPTQGSIASSRRGHSGAPITVSISAQRVVVGALSQQPEQRGVSCFVHNDACHARSLGRLNRRMGQDGYEDAWYYEQCGGCRYWIALQGAIGSDYGASTGTSASSTTAAPSSPNAKTARSDKARTRPTTRTASAGIGAGQDASARCRRRTRCPDTNAHAWLHGLTAGPVVAVFTFYLVTAQA